MTIRLLIIRTTAIGVIACALAACRPSLPFARPTAPATPAADAAASGEVTPAPGATKADAPPAPVAAGTDAASSAESSTPALPATIPEPPAPIAPSVDPAEAIRADFLARLGFPLAQAQGLGIEGVVVFEVSAPSGAPPLWVAHTVGMRDFSTAQMHRIALYRLRNDGDVAEVAHLNLNHISAGGSGTGGPGTASAVADAPDYLGPGGVSQAPIEPSSVWLTLEGGAGAHGGTFALLRFDGERLTTELAARGDSPGVGQVRDVDGDGIGEVVIDATDSYVFCYACGVRLPHYALWRLDGDRFVQVLAQPLPGQVEQGETSPELVAANDDLLRLAAANLWMDVAAALDRTQAMLDADPQLNDPSGAFHWNLLLLRLNEEARRALLRAPSAYPLLDHVFYGDYAGAVDLLRTIPPDQLFSAQSPAIVGTVAQGWEESLALRLDHFASAALEDQPENAPAWFLRGWGAWLMGSTDLALREIEQAAALAPNDDFYASAMAQLQSMVHSVAPRLLAHEPTSLRAGPGDAYPEVGALLAGEAVSVTGQVRTGPDERWWQVVRTDGGGRHAWVRDDARIEVAAADLVAEVAAPALLSPVAQRGRIFFSAPGEGGVAAVYAIDVVANAKASLVIDQARAPALQPQGQIVAFSSQRSDMYGLGGFALRTGERLRFTYHLEDTLPRWDDAGERLYFWSDREGDRIPRIYRTWAGEDAAVEILRAGQDADVQRGSQRIVFKGCDVQGASCGLWTMAADGSDSTPLTDVAGDSRPRWSPAGDAVVFMSDQRDGNWEVYLLDVASAEVVRLTEDASHDGLPTFSPDGSQIAFVSNRDGAWGIFVLPVPAGEPETPNQPALLYRIGADLPDWLEQSLDWTP